MSVLPHWLDSWYCVRSGDLLHAHSLSPFISFLRSLSLSFLSPDPCPTIPPLFRIFPRNKVVQMALPCVGILDFPVSRSMSNDFLYNFLRLWHSIITAENWAAEKCLQKTWNFYIRKRITDRKSSQMARIFEPVSQLQV